MFKRDDAGGSCMSYCSKEFEAGKTKFEPYEIQLISVVSP